jgi:hypothetical protein
MRHDEPATATGGDKALIAHAANTVKANRKDRKEELNNEL